MGKVKNKYFRIIIALALLFYLSGCRDTYSYYLRGSLEQKQVLRRLFKLLEQQEEEVGENRFILVQQIANRLLGTGEREKAILFLTTYVEQNPRDPYNGYYLGVVAQSYKELAALPLAIHYYERILLNYPDLAVNGGSIHFSCLQEMINLVDEPEERIGYYKELISRFSENIDLGVAYYFLARAYEEVGQWEQAIRTFQKFLKYPEAEIPGSANAHARIREKVDFYYSDKSWAVENLQTLVEEIKRAIRTRNTRRLLTYQAKVNFFTMSWSQAEADEHGALIFDIGSFLHTSRVTANPELDIDSNAGEAFLRTTRWSYRIPTWYLYFRKVNFKPDPEINGRWEWAGIYLGEKL